MVALVSSAMKGLAFESLLEVSPTNFAEVALQATARLDNHVLILLHDNICVVIEVENEHRLQLLRSAAWLRYIVRIDEVHKILRHCVSGGFDSLL